MIAVVISVVVVMALGPLLGRGLPGARRRLAAAMALPVVFTAGLLIAAPGLTPMSNLAIVAFTTAPPFGPSGNVVSLVAFTPSLEQLLVDAARWNVDREADVEPIQALLDQYCDLEADVLPVVARTVPELPRPLKNWGAQWLVREILAAREQRLNRFADSVKGVAASARI